HSLARAVARAVKRQTQAQGTQDDEVNLLAFILKEEMDTTDKCETKLKEYCGNLKKIDPKLNKISSKLEKICEDSETIKGKCKDLKDKITKKCQNSKQEIEKTLTNPSTVNCKKNEQDCLFLEEACLNDLKNKCNELRNTCYQKKRDETADEVLLRALSGNLKNDAGCKKKLEEVCQELDDESDELMKRCLYQEKTCEDLLKKGENKCNTLKTEIKTLNNKFQEKCRSLLEQCHFYEPSCKDEYKPNCKELTTKCENAKITYIPPGLDFDPTKPKTTLAEKIDLKELYTEAIKKGVYIGRTYAKDAITLLALSTLHLSDSGKVGERKKKCEEILKNNCKNPQEHKILRDLCTNNSDITEEGKKICNKLDERLAERTLIVSEKINRHLGNKANEIISWYKLLTFLTEKECTRLQSDCFYLKGQSQLEKLCNNLKAACYKKGLEAVANEVLQDKLRGKLHGSNETWLETLQKDLVKVCEKMKGESDELFVLCINPIKTALTVSTDLRMRAVALREQLNDKRDYPTKEDCKELEKKCNVLGQDSSEIKWPCYTLSQHCNRLESIEYLENKLLEKKLEGLKNETICREKTKELCKLWIRRRNVKFSYACSTLEVTCKKINESLNSKCNALKEHMAIHDVVKEAEKKEEYCRFWTPYCEKFTPSCNELEKNKGKGCKKLNEKCKLFFEKKKLEDKAIDEFKGSLSTNTDCEGTLEKYCVALNNATNGLETLCKSNNSTKEKVRKETCKRLVERVQEKCPGLKKELEETKEVLVEKEKEYKDVKEKAEEAMKKASLVLSKAKIENNKSANEVVPNAPAVPSGAKDTKSFRLIRRDATVKVTEDEAKAFDLVAQAFGLYVELREICHDLLKGCGFKKECKCESQCKEIKKICSKIEPLEVKPYKIETVTKNITTTTTTTTTKTEGEGKTAECQSLQTTDTWVTKTSTHTSTSTTTSTVTSRITLTSTRRCKPTKCTTGEEDDAGEVKPSEGLRMSGWSVMRGVLLAMMISFMI
ncbi:uncharacterized protein T551_00911, partial [Pneumocystis jirovecii RU7]